LLIILSIEPGENMIAVIISSNTQLRMDVTNRMLIDIFFIYPGLKENLFLSCAYKNILAATTGHSSRSYRITVNMNNFQEKRLNTCKPHRTLRILQKK
jgi:hypothetical protein